MIGVGFAKILDSEIVDGKSKSGRTRIVAPQTRGKAEGSITVRG